LAEAEVVPQQHLRVTMRVLVEVIVLLMVLLLLEAEAVRLTGMAVVIVMEELEAQEAEVLLRIRMLEMEVQERRAKVIMGAVMVLIQLLIQEGAVEVPQLSVQLLVREPMELEVLDDPLILLDLR
jgi:hypothetical protein